MAAECAPRSSVVESAEATCVRGADFHPNKPNNLLANEPLLSGGGERLRFRRRHSCRWNAAANLGEENSVHSAVEPTMNWRHWGVGCDQLGVLDIVGVLLL